MKSKQKKALSDFAWVASFVVIAVWAAVIFIRLFTSPQKNLESEDDFITALASLGMSQTEDISLEVEQDTIFSKAKTLEDTIIIAAVLYSSEYLSPSKVIALCYTESRFNPVVIGSIGEIGLMQILPSSARQVGFCFPESLFNPVYNIRAGNALLEYYCEFYGGRLPGISAYTTGHQGGTFARKYDRLLQERARRWVWL